MKRTLALVLAMIMMLTFLPVSSSVKAVETDKAKIYIDYLGSGNAPRDTAQPLPKFDQQAVANGTVIWLGLGIEDLSKLDLAVDGLFNVEVAFDYNPKYLVPCGMNASEGKDNWYNLAVAANLKSDVAVGDTLYWDANNYAINKDDALFAGSVDVTAGRELPQNMPSDNWDGAWKSVALNIQKKTADTAATNRFAGTQPAQRSYLVRLPFQLKGIPADGAELKDKMAVVLSLSPNTFVMGSGADGTSPYAQWRANDAAYDDPDTNLKNKLVFGGDIDIFSPSGAVLTGLDIFGVTGTDKQVVTLSPDFAQATTNYTAEIPRDKENLWVQPKIDVDAGTAIQAVELVRDGTAVPGQFTLSGDVYTASVSGLQSDDIVKITVVGANSELAVYYVELKTAVELPLINLELKGQSDGETDLSITLNPTFDPAAFSYSAQIPANRTTLLVTATLKNGATLSNIQHLRSGLDLSDLTVDLANNSGTVPIANLQDGDVIRVTGLNADGTNKEYDITMNQAKAYLTALEVYGSKTADDTVVTTPVPLSPSFKWDVVNYKIVLPTDSETLNVKPTLPNGCAVQSVERIRESNDGSEDKLSFTSSGDPIVYSASIADITEGDTIHITVTQQDGENQTYIIEITSTIIEDTPTITLNKGNATEEDITKYGESGADLGVTETTIFVYYQYKFRDSGFTVMAPDGTAMSTDLVERSYRVKPNDGETGGEWKAFPTEFSQFKEDEAIPDIFTVDNSSEYSKCYEIKYECQGGEAIRNVFVIYQLGDVFIDGVVDFSDAARLNQHALGIAELVGLSDILFKDKVANVFAADDVVDFSDAARLNQHALGISAIAQYYDCDEAIRVMTFSKI